MISEEQKEHYKKLVEGRVKSLMKMHIYNWTRIMYTENNCLLYLFSRAPAEYAVLHRIFREIARRSPDFKPKSLFDFGSGVGTVTWYVINSLFIFYYIHTWTGNVLKKIN